MEDEIKQLREKLETLERQKKEEDERNKDPFRHLRDRIDNQTKLLAKLHEPTSNGTPDGIRIITRDLECDKSILQAILALQAEVKALRNAHVNPRPSPKLEEVDILL